MTRALCVTCGWTCETGPERTRTELNRAMIDHHVETGHSPIGTIESDRRPDSTEASDRGRVCHGADR